jgi:hypothetical protein
MLITLLLSACNTDTSPVEEIRQKPVNYMVLLDLSDRLITSGQAERDIEIIKAVFEEFSRTVRMNLVINSSDKFQVIIAPQKGVPYNTGEYENSLFIDMSSLSAGVKLNSMAEFELQLTPLLQDLYSKAFLGDKTTSYPGTGMWQFFNENLEYLACRGYENNLIVLTDGYFDLEDYSRQLPDGNRYPTTSFLSSVRNKSDWKMTIEKNDMGLIPVNKEFSGVRVFVSEINPKYDFQYESDMLVYVWKKWCAEMEIDVTEVLLKTSLPQTTNLLKSKLADGGKAEKRFMSVADKY